MTRPTRPRPEGTITRGTTAPNRLRRADRWIVANLTGKLRAADESPLAVDLGFGASPVTTVELYDRLRAVRPDVQVAGLEIDPERVEEGRRFLAGQSETDQRPGLSFALGGFEIPTARRPLLIRAFNVLRQYDEEQAWQAWDRLCARLAADGTLVEGTCDEIGRRAVWVTMGRGGTTGGATITFAARVSSLERPSELAERLPKTLIHHNVPGEGIHEFLAAFDRSWAIAAPHAVFGPRQRWIGAVEHLAQTWPVVTRPPAGGRGRWRLGEVTLPWEAVSPR